MKKFILIAALLIIPSIALAQGTPVRVTNNPFTVTIQCQASTSAPTYSAGLQNLSCDLSGNTRVYDANLYSAAIAATPAGTNIIGKVGIDQTTPGTTNGVQLTAGTALAGKFGIDQTTPGTTNGVQANIASGGVVSGALADGAISTLGLKADAATCATSNTAMACFRQLHTDVTSAIPAGTNQIGNLVADTHGQCSTLCASLVAKGSAGTLKTFEVWADSTLSGAAWYVMVFDATSLPANGTVTPAKCYAQASGTTQMGGNLSTGGDAFTTGIVIGVSTTGCFSTTASTHAFIAASYQ